ncbi:MAG TPA: reverse transcriptase domain-containing protein, partial [Steroidobacteraceae bacterium]|nr:reverse transcriptase domain-containing protein [Steroidobacteraceae bacterium]
MQWLAPGSGRPAVVTAQTRAQDAVRRRQPPSAAGVVGRLRSEAALGLPWWLDSCDISILPFTTQIKYALQTPPLRQALKLKVTFCVRGVLSPLLANVLLDEVDKELEKRGHAFVRYADDCNVYARSPRAGQRVMEL